MWVMWRCECEREKVKMWVCEDVKMSRCEDEKMWRWADVKMSRCEDEQMWRWEGVKMRRCEDEKVWEKMWRWEGVREGVKMRRWDTDPHYWKNPALRRSREKSRMAFSLAGARLFAFLARSGWYFFLSCLWRYFMITSFRSRPRFGLC